MHLSETETNDKKLSILTGKKVKNYTEYKTAEKEHRNENTGNELEKTNTDEMCCEKIFEENLNIVKSPQIIVETKDSIQEEIQMKDASKSNDIKVDDQTIQVNAAKEMENPQTIVNDKTETKKGESAKNKTKEKNEGRSKELEECKMITEVNTKEDCQFENNSSKETNLKIIQQMGSQEESKEILQEVNLSKTDRLTNIKENNDLSDEMSVSINSRINDDLLEEIENKEIKDELMCKNGKITEENSKQEKEEMMNSNDKENVENEKRTEEEIKDTFKNHIILIGIPKY